MKAFVLLLATLVCCTTLPAQTARMQTREGISPAANVYCALRDRAGRLWFGTSDEGIYRYEGSAFTQYTTADGLSHNGISAIVEDAVGQLWIGTNNGVCRFDPSASSASGGPAFIRVKLPGDTLIALGQDATALTALSQPILSLAMDRRGLLWIGTTDHGIYRYDGKTFTNFLPFEVVKCIREDRAGNIWFGSWRNGGVYRFDGRRAFQPCIAGRCGHTGGSPRELAAHNKHITSTFQQFTMQDGLPDPMVACLLEDQQGRIWAGTRDRGMCRFDGEAFVADGTRPGILRDNVNCMLQDRSGQLWIGHDGEGLWRSAPSDSPDAGGRVFTHFTTREGLVNDHVFCLVEDLEGNIWVGTRDLGLCRYDGVGFVRFSERVR